VFVLEDDVRHALNIQTANRNKRLVRQTFLISLSLHKKTASCLDAMTDGDQQMDKRRKKRGKKVIKRKNRRYKGRDKEVRYKN